MADPKNAEDSGLRTCELLEERNQRLMFLRARLQRYETLVSSKDAMIGDLQSLVGQLQKDIQELRQKAEQKV